MPGLALVLTLFIALLVAPAAEAKRKTCSVRGADVVAKNRRAVVLTRTVPDGLGESTEIWGCLRAKKRPVRVTSSGYSQYSSSTITAIGLRGTFVGTSSSSSVVDGT